MFTKKCFFCKSRKGTEYAPAYGMYRKSLPGNWYHDKCLEQVLGEPEKYPHYVDMAIDIIDRIQQEANLIKEKKEYQKRRINKARKYIK